MHSRRSFRQTARLAWVGLTVLALLGAQGLRVCIHGADGIDAFADPAPAMSVESVLAPGDDGPSSSTQDVSLFAILDASTASLPFLVFPAVLLLLLPWRSSRRLSLAPEFRPRAGRSYYLLRPPLRAPPR